MDLFSKNALFSIKYQMELDWSMQPLMEVVKRALSAFRKLRILCQHIYIWKEETPISILLAAFYEIAVDASLLLRNGAKSPLWQSAAAQLRCESAKLRGPASVSRAAWKSVGVCHILLRFGARFPAASLQAAGHRLPFWFSITPLARSHTHT
jgi:hypothetical protein